MPTTPTPSDFVRCAMEVEQSFRVADGVYLVGSLERGVTVYKQQVRAHNLSWAIRELQLAGQFKSLNRVAIVGGGICGLTTAACFLSLLPGTSVTLFEERWDVCPLQQGSDNRWLHPTIYDWPEYGTRSPEAKLPVLNWTEGRASDVARRIILGFAQVLKAFDSSADRLQVFLGVKDLHIDVAENAIEWIGSKTTRFESFFAAGPVGRDASRFDLVVIAAGFGLEVSPTDYPSPSYWRNEQIGQPILNGNRVNFLVSGYGDGALTDLFRLTIERFRQDTILYELFADRLDDVEDQFRTALSERSKENNILPLFEDAERQGWLEVAKVNLRSRIRKDTKVVLHAKGRGVPTSVDHVYGPHSSFLSRLLTFLLLRNDAFSVCLGGLEEAASGNAVTPANVICRYGSDPLGHVRDLFTSSNGIYSRLQEMKAAMVQTPRIVWRPGVFPIAS